MELQNLEDKNKHSKYAYRYAPCLQKRIFKVAIEANDKGGDLVWETQGSFSMENTFKKRSHETKLAPS